MSRGYRFLFAHRRCHCGKPLPEVWANVVDLDLKVEAALVLWMTVGIRRSVHDPSTAPSRLSEQSEHGLLVGLHPGLIEGVDANHVATDGHRVLEEIEHGPDTRCR